MRILYNVMLKKLKAVVKNQRSAETQYPYKIHTIVNLEF